MCVFTNNEKIVFYLYDINWVCINLVLAWKNFGIPNNGGLSVLISTKLSVYKTQDPRRRSFVHVFLPRFVGNFLTPKWHF